MSNETEANHDIQVFVRQLSEAADKLLKDDLSTLAKMHGWCEQLSEATNPQASQPSPTMHAIAASLAQNLEALILGDAQDLDQTVADVVTMIAELADPASTSPSAQSASTTESVDQSDAEVAARLADVFDEEPRPVAEASGSDGATTPVEAATSVPPYESQPLVIGEKEAEFVAGFVEEAREHIEAIEVAVLDVEKSSDGSAKIDDLFRPFHTIKGMAGFLNLRDVNCLAHEVETLLDQGRKGQRQITSDLIDLIFETVDILKVQIESIAGYLTNPEGNTVPQPPVGRFIDKLRAVAAGRSVCGVGLSDGSPDPEAPPAETADAPTAEASTAGAPVAGAELTADDQSRDRKGASPTQPQVAQQTSEASSGASLGTAPASGPAATGSRPAASDQSVRIETAKLDALVDMVGELVIAQTLVEANSKIAEDPKLSKDSGQVAKIVRDVQEVAMAMRMVPIGPTFQRMARLVRDVSRKADKKVELIISGEDTELDKNVTQQIGDPLVHMVRNAVDHGIELPQDRIAAGKSEVGHVHLSAAHQGGNIVIQIQDDGKGLDPEKLIAKGIEKGIVQPGEELTDEQAYSLIFAPGFSTAAQVTDISGRGVGMDVVKRNIEQLRGRTEIASGKGRGSTFSICLPLTLAIIDGMVVRVGGERFIFPTITIEQALRPRPEQITTVQQKGEVVKVRGRLIPLIQLGELFGLSDHIDPCQAMVVIAHNDGRQIGVVVEELLGQQQVVIKTLGERFESLRGVSGAAILGDGRVGLILEMSGITAAFNERHLSSKVTPTRSRMKPPPRANQDREEETSVAPTSPPVTDERLTPVMTC
ncbi:MAG: chemotaxis protein CheA [Phycisphaerae bacterium]|nr:chemotaxis protein CheA [Phycisphaerae bacterium]